MTAPFGTESICSCVSYEFPSLPKSQTHIMSRMPWSWIIQRDILNGVSRTDDLGGPLLAFGRPHGQAGQKAAVPVLEFAKCIRHIAAGDDIRLVLNL